MKEELKQQSLFNNSIDSAEVIKEEEPKLDYKYKNLEEVKQAALNCTKCQLCKTRTNVVFSDGNPGKGVMLIGEGPGQQEDETGLPFVGKAGQLLDKILESVDIYRQKDVYICNIVKCRPPGNRAPLPEEMEACWEYLEGQIKFLQPKIILLAGATAVKGILKTKEGITKIRGKWYDNVFGAKAMPIFHPSYLLRNQSKNPGSPKWLMWQDVKEIKKEIDLL